MTSISIPRVLAKSFLWLSQFTDDNTLLLVCKGYDEDNNNFTGLYWGEDKDLDLTERTYFNFQLWFNVN